MKEDKLHILRKTLTIISLILVFSTIGLFMISTQIKTVTLDYYGNVKKIKTLASDVNDFLIQNKIILGENDIIVPERNAILEKNTDIKISTSKELAKIDIEEIRKNHIPMVAKMEQIEEAIPFSEEKRDNPAIQRGTENTVQEGVEGKKATEFLVRYKNNKEVNRIQVGEKLIAEPQNKVIEVGTKITLTTSRSNIVQSVVSQGNTEGFRQYNIGLPIEQQQYAYNISRRYGIQYELFLAVMYKESRFNPNAFGGGNSYGLCQIHVSNHSNLRAKLGVSNFFDPYDNMTAGAYLLSKYFSTANSVVSGPSVEVYALNSYNMGEGVYYSSCYSKGILNREYSNSVIAIRNRLVSTGTL